MTEGSSRITNAAHASATDAVPFTVDGESLVARSGTLIAAALLAHGRRVCHTTVQRGTARGIFCATGVCGDCTMQVDGVPGVRTCVTPVRAGMRVETQHGLGTWQPPVGDAGTTP